MILDDDVMAFTRFMRGYGRRNFLKVLEIDMNQFKSIWGLMLGILLLGVNRPRKPGYPHNGLLYLKAHEDKE